jgi:toxin CptA
MGVLSFAAPAARPPFLFIRLPMPIAVSAIVRPSRVHRGVVAVAGLSLIAAAFAVGAIAPERFHANLFQAAVLAFAGAVLMHAGSARAKTHRIDISGTGEVALTVQQGLRERIEADEAAGVVLAPGAVLWPFLMLLRFQDGAARMVVLPVWRDSVEPDAWRLLAVAVRAIGRRQ